MPWWGWLLVAVAFVLGLGVMYLGLMAYLARGFRW
jgi:hypothetical protein